MFYSLIFQDFGTLCSANNGSNLGIATIWEEHRIATWSNWAQLYSDSNPGPGTWPSHQNTQSKDSIGSISRLFWMGYLEGKSSYNLLETLWASPVEVFKCIECLVVSDGYLNWTELKSPSQVKCKKTKRNQTIPMATKTMAYSRLHAVYALQTGFS